MSMYETVDYYDTFNALNMPMDFWNAYYSQKTEREMLDLAYDMIQWPEGYPACLKGLSVEEQMDFYGVATSEYFDKASYGEVASSSCSEEKGVPLRDYPKLRKLIVKDGIVVGALIYAVGTYKSMFPYRSVTTYLSIDTDGTGSSTAEDSAYLYCILPDMK